MIPAELPEVEIEAGEDPISAYVHRFAEIDPQTREEPPRPNPG